ncbi:MAG: hypothetical protein Q3979_09855 [Actinomycetaceae bacterium]|nr:hypothetical protein [Actinomycetaceae bacterium]
MPSSTLPDRSTAALEGMSALPTRSGISFRGITSTTSNPEIIVTRGFTATSRDPVVATAGFTSPGIAVVVGKNGRDVTPLSAHPAARETVFLPGTVFHTGWTINVDGHRVEVIEELTRDEYGQWSAQGINLSKLAEALRRILAKAQNTACPVSIDYCQRFSDAIF